MEMNTSRSVLCIAFLLGLLHSTVSTDHKVGWAMGVNLPDWAQKEHFLVGDTLSKSIDGRPHHIYHHIVLKLLVVYIHCQYFDTNERDI